MATLHISRIGAPSLVVPVIDICEDGWKVCLRKLKKAVAWEITKADKTHVGFWRIQLYIRKSFQVDINSEPASGSSRSPTSVQAPPNGAERKLSSITPRMKVDFGTRTSVPQAFARDFKPQIITNGSLGNGFSNNNTAAPGRLVSRLENGDWVEVDEMIHTEHFLEVLRNVGKTDVGTGGFSIQCEVKPEHLKEKPKCRPYRGKDDHGFYRHAALTEGIYTVELDCDSFWDERVQGPWPGSPLGEIIGKADATGEEKEGTSSAYGEGAEVGLEVQKTSEMCGEDEIRKFIDTEWKEGLGYRILDSLLVSNKARNPLADAIYHGIGNSSIRTLCFHDVRIGNVESFKASLERSEVETLILSKLRFVSKEEESSVVEFVQQLPGNMQRLKKVIVPANCVVLVKANIRVPAEYYKSFEDWHENRGECISKESAISFAMEIPAMPPSSRPAVPGSLGMSSSTMRYPLMTTANSPPLNNAMSIDYTPRFDDGSAPLKKPKLSLGNSPPLNKAMISVGSSSPPLKGTFSQGSGFHGMNRTPSFVQTASESDYRLPKKVYDPGFRVPENITKLKFPLLRRKSDCEEDAGDEEEDDANEFSGAGFGKKAMPSKKSASSSAGNGGAKGKVAKGKGNCGKARSSKAGGGSAMKSKPKPKAPAMAKALRTVRKPDPKPKAASRPLTARAKSAGKSSKPVGKGKSAGKTAKAKVSSMRKKK